MTDQHPAAGHGVRTAAAHLVAAFTHLGAEAMGQERPGREHRGEALSDPGDRMAAEAPRPPSGRCNPNVTEYRT
ncbi:hypothetical protein ACFWOT_25555 [Streptomyces sp. NPDC058440]|uniref:hypothetical protein n=1 Tax=Streptomyces sp. NPDC058440 TaxID=3346501 RepID=UPI00366181CC